MKRKAMLLAVVPVGIFLYFLPMMKFRMREGTNLDRLKRLGQGVSLYMADHEGQYPVITDEDFLAASVNGKRVLRFWPLSNPLAPYLKRAEDAYDPAFQRPYLLRFVQTLPSYNPRDPMAVAKLNYLRSPEPNDVVAISPYVGELGVGWRNVTEAFPENVPLPGYYYALRGDGGARKVMAGEVRLARYDAKIKAWSEPEPNRYHSSYVGGGLRLDWPIFPGESWPLKTKLVGQYVPPASRPDLSQE